MPKDHVYKTTIEWLGNMGKGTETYSAYNRNHKLSIQNKPSVHMSSDKTFRGDALKYNPEDLLVAAISSCHMLWYLHLCADNGIVVTAYTDNATGTMQTLENGSGHFTGVALHPEIQITNIDKIDVAYALHTEAKKMCFIANSVNFAIEHIPKIMVI